MTAEATPPPPTDRIIRRILLAFAVISAVLVAVVVIAVRNINRSELSADWVNHTHAVILEVDSVLADAHVGDGALRTFVMTGDTHDLTTAREAFSSMSEHLEIAKALTRDEPAQHDQILKLETLANKRAEVGTRVLAAWPNDHAAAVRLLIAADAEAATTSEIRRAVEKLKSDEMALLADRDTASFLQAQTTRWTVWSGVALDFVLLGGVAWLIRDDMLARRRAIEVLEAANVQLDEKVRARTAELSAANERLTAENLERRWAHQAMEHQLHYHQMIVNSINDLVLVVTKVLNISRVNPAVVHLTGAEPSALINRPLSSIVRLANPPAGVDPLAAALREGRDLRDLPAFITDLRGQPVAVRFTLFPVRDGNKVVGGVVILELAPIQPAAAS